MIRKLSETVETRNYNTEYDIEDESSNEEGWVVVGPSCKGAEAPDTALYSLPPGDPAFIVITSPPLPALVSQELS